MKFIREYSILEVKKLKPAPVVKVDKFVNTDPLLFDKYSYVYQITNDKLSTPKTFSFFSNNGNLVPTVNPSIEFEFNRGTKRYIVKDNTISFDIMSNFRSSLNSLGYEPTDDFDMDGRTRELRVFPMEDLIEELASESILGGPMCANVLKTKKAKGKKLSDRIWKNFYGYIIKNNDRIKDIPKESKEYLEPRLDKMAKEMDDNLKYFYRFFSDKLRKKYRHLGIEFGIFDD